MNFTKLTRRVRFTLIELMVCVGLTSMLGTALYYMMTGATNNFTWGTRSLEIIQTCSLVMTSLRKELRGTPVTPNVINNKLIIKTGENKEKLYFYDPKAQRLYSGVREESKNEPMPGVDLEFYKFDNGQIVDFHFDASDRGEEAWLLNEMSLNNRYWFKAEMEVVFAKNWKQLNEIDKQKILADPKNRRRFSLTITPRQKNWLLQNTQ